MFFTRLESKWYLCTIYIYLIVDGERERERERESTRIFKRSEVSLWCPEKDISVCCRYVLARHQTRFNAELVANRRTNVEENQHENTACAALFKKISRWAVVCRIGAWRDAARVSLVVLRSCHRSVVLWCFYAASVVMLVVRGSSRVRNVWPRIYAKKHAAHLLGRENQPMPLIRG